MRIIEINENNFESFQSILIELNDEFLSSINVIKERSHEQKIEILKHMIDLSNPTHLIIGLDQSNQAVGMAYFNTGTGYSCGGDYLWLNSIYIRPNEQQKGYGSEMIYYIEHWAKERDYKLFMSSRDTDNEQSKKLFDRAGFEQSNNISINKTY